MDVDHPERDQRWDNKARSETETQRLDRNWDNLLQELRVSQTGVQLLTGFLLTLPFQQRFDQLDDLMRAVYVATVGCSLTSTMLLVAPVAMHRVLFRQRRIKTLVSAAHRLAMAGLALLGLALVGVAVVVVGMVYGRTAGFVAGGVALAGFVALWILLPVILRASRGDDDSP
jgi:mannose/fructose/N-acetylgalactosamine-specific phosphotransferase system component IIC